MIRFVGVFCFVNIFLISHTSGELLVDRLRKDFLKLEDDLWKYVLEQSKYGFNDTDDPGLSLIRVFDSFDEELQKMPQDILYGMEVIRQAPTFLFLFSDIRVIDDMYDKFRLFLSTSVTNDNNVVSVVDERETKNSHIIDDVLRNPKNNMTKITANIFRQTFSEEENENVMSTLFDILSNPQDFCKHLIQSPQQIFYNLYNAIALADLKGYIMTQYAYLAERLEERGNHTIESIQARKKFEKRVNDTLTVRSVMRIMPRKLWQCDPKHHLKGVTYDELTALIQGHIENEVDMNNKGSCRENCAAFPVAQSYGCYDKQSAYCTKRKKCSGKIIGCKFVESHMKACLSPSYSSRRYDYIEYKSGKVLGKKQKCENKDINSWFRWFVHCSYCLCLCDQEGPHSDRYFNLRPVTADVANNRVVTGLRIVKRNRIIHLQIQEGKLLPYGYIDNTTVRWVPVDDYKITDRGVANGVDFHTMSYMRRTMFLDNLKSHETDHIITGVRFEFIDDHLKFEINVRAFDFETGKLSNDSHYIYSGEKREKLKIENPDVPTESPHSEANFESNAFVEFTHSSFDKDAAQTTVPFFDLQPVAPHPALPLSGAGIYYKGKPGFGGFVAPEVTTFDFSTHMEFNLPEMEQRKDPENKVPNIA